MGEMLLRLRRCQYNYPACSEFAHYNLENERLPKAILAVAVHLVIVGVIQHRITVKVAFHRAFQEALLDDNEICKGCKQNIFRVSPVK